MKKKTIVGLIAILAVVVAVMFAGCVEKEKTPASAPMPTATPDLETTISPAQTATPLPTVSPAPTEDSLTITEDDFKRANEAIESKNKELGAWSIPGVATFDLGQGSVQPEDVFVYALIKYHNKRKTMPPSSVVESAIEKSLGEYNLSRWKLSAIRAFWIDYSTANFNLDELGSEDKIIGSFLWYLDVKFIERQKLINKKFEAFVTAEEMRQNAMQDWTEHENKVQDREEQARLERDCYQVLWNVEWAIQKAAE
ncbi:MAG: hypothetical protein U9R43_07910 [Thermodesulfobacteriota bacterium]|nr:hypothetical protein [Thermodesulfobacteriota bacterium]